MNNYFKIAIVGVLFSGFSACASFFQENSQNYSYVTSVKDLQELIVGGAYEYTAGYDPKTCYAEDANLMSFEYSRGFPFIHLLDDDIAEYGVGSDSKPADGATSWTRSFLANAHRWQRKPFINNVGRPYEDAIWKRLYNRIAVTNSVIYQLSEMREAEKDQNLCCLVEGEARYLRASHYFYLVNIYAEPYDKEIAEEQLGVPLKTTEFIEDRLFSRASLKDVYAQIVEDLTIAEQSLKGLKPANTNRVSHAAAATLLSRVYLFMEEYEKAIDYANIAIANKNYSLLDLNERTPEDNFIFGLSPETLFSQGGYSLPILLTDNRISTNIVTSQANAFRVSDELYGIFDQKDMRKWTFFVSPHFIDGSMRCLKMRNLDQGAVSDYLLLRLAEAYLNKAEAEAALNRTAAQNTISQLLIKRYAMNDVPQITQTGDELLTFIREERRRELCFEGHRWFDLRRYAVNKRLPFSKEIRHVALRSISTSYEVAGVYILKPYHEDKAAYMFPIPEFALIFNEGVLVDNPERPDREIITE